MEDVVYYKNEPPFFRVLLNRPQALNALDYNTLKSLEEAINEAAKSETRFVLIESLDSRSFAAGADVKFFSSLEAKPLNDYIIYGKKVFDKLATLEKITFSLVDGYCLGGGFELALSTDFIIATQKSKFGLPEVSLGLVPGFSGFYRLAFRVGLQSAKRLIVTGKILTFEEARSLGIVDFESQNSDFDATKNLILDNFGSASPFACKKAKHVINTYLRPLKCFLDDLETASFLECFEHEEGKEGVKAFLEKRKSSFNIK
ncbi:MAG: enoyl-CoA hydratase/isomerase family protein [Deltaproteobacteria bacterium]|nr:enoyl-CoA hydratase/isomerase family protein [Deltaproteobacteria bacterium]MCX7952896.1 enoyl-CoA hydratase/isomerase family protein [Deltaproteobacteria bacterium]